MVERHRQISRPKGGEQEVFTMPRPSSILLKALWPRKAFSWPIDPRGKKAEIRDRDSRPDMRLWFHPLCTWSPYPSGENLECAELVVPNPTILAGLMSFTQIHAPYQFIPVSQWPKKRAFVVKTNKGACCASWFARHWVPSGRRTARLQRRRALPYLVGGKGKGGYCLDLGMAIYTWIFVLYWSPGPGAWSRKELTMADGMLEIKKRGKHITSKALNKRQENGGSLGMGKIPLLIRIDSQRGLLLRIWVKLLPVFAATRV